MNSTSIIVTILTTSCEVLVGQGLFALNNLSPVDNALVFDAEGQLLNGPRYVVELYGGPTADSLTPATAFSSHIITTAPFYEGALAGYFSTAQIVAVHSVPHGGWAWLQVRAWDTQLGATYEEVSAQEMGGYGESPLFYAKGGDPFDQFPLPAPLTGLESFSLRAVIPEPSSGALLVLGGLGLCWAARRQVGP